MCSTNWNHMRLRTQIILRLAVSIVFLFLLYMTVLFTIFEGYYKPDVLGHFKKDVKLDYDLEIEHMYRTSNMTLAISQSFQAFEGRIHDSVGKI